MLTTVTNGLPAARPATAIEPLRAREFARLDRTGTTYLDYTGAALYPESMIRREAERLSAGVFGNPHSESAASRASTDSLRLARALTLQLFDADPAEYEVVFTANASAAIRILAEAFPFGPGSRLVMTADNHNSVNGLRLAAESASSTVDYVPLNAELRADDPIPLLQPATAPSLFAFPAQSNFSGVRHPLAWVAAAQRRGYQVLLDAAAYAGTSALSLKAVPADFVAISYYKLFGYPTGVGALIARRTALAALGRRFFGGGTVELVSVQDRFVRLRPGGERFEDGTVNFLGMAAVCDGLRWLTDLGMPAIQRHIADLTQHLLAALSGLGRRVVIHGPLGTAARGGTVAFNLRRGGKLLPFEPIEEAARQRGLAIRGGCFCNPGAAEHAFGHPPDRARECGDGPFSTQCYRDCLGGAPVGALRASVGIPTNHQDIDRLIECVVALTD